MSLLDPTRVSGVWRGVAELGGERIIVRADLFQSAQVVRGVLYLGMPDAGPPVGLGTLTGTCEDEALEATTPGGVSVAATFSERSGAGALVGSLSLPRPDGTGATATLDLRRLPGSRNRFVPITPSRLHDTRFEYEQPLRAGREQRVAVTGRFGIPWNGVGAVVVNITGTEALGPGYVTAWASGTDRPGTANLNLEFAGQTAGNFAVVPVGEDGYISLYTQSGAHLVVDAFGWFSTESILQRPSAPTRVLDTRPATPVGYLGPKPGPGGSVLVSLAGAGGMPASGASAALVNIVATEATAPGYITAWAEGRPQPFTANLNVDAPGQTIGNFSIVPVNDRSELRLFTQSGTHLVVDLFGWFPVETTDVDVSVAPDPLGNLVVDGSFEGWTTIPSESGFRSVQAAVLGAWIVSDGNVDLVGPNQAVAHDGNQFVDLNGNEGRPGTIEQMIVTDPSRQYRVSFMLAGNPNAQPAVKQVEVTFGSGRHVFEFDATGRTNEDLGWSERSFVATPDCGSYTTLSLRSLTPGTAGPNIDAVSVVDAGPADGCRPGGYRAIDPARLLDTRAVSPVGYSGPKPGVGGEVRVQVAGVGGIAASAVAAVAVNITATEADAPGYVTAWPSGTERPTTSSLNLTRAGETRGNHAIVPVGADGSITLFTQSGTHLVVDAFGWFT